MTVDNLTDESAVESQGTKADYSAGQASACEYCEDVEVALI